MIHLTWWGLPETTRWIFRADSVARKMLNAMQCFWSSQLVEEYWKLCSVFTPRPPSGLYPQSFPNGFHTMDSTVNNLVLGLMLSKANSPLAIFSDMVSQSCFPWPVLPHNPLHLGTFLSSTWKLSSETSTKLHVSIIHTTIRKETLSDLQVEAEIIHNSAKRNVFIL